MIQTCSVDSLLFISKAVYLTTAPTFYIVTILKESAYFNL